MTERLLPQVLRDYGRDAATAFRQAPLEVGLGVVTAIASSVAMRQQAEDEFVRVAVAAALALPLLFGLSLLRARGVIAGAARWSASAAVLLGAAAYATWVFAPSREAEGWRVAALFGAAVMAVSLVPAVGTEKGAPQRTAFWLFNARLLTRIVTVVAYGGALFAALAGAVAAVSALFDLATSEYLYGDLAGAVFCALVPWIVVGGIPELIAAPEDARVPRLVALLGRYLYAPVLSVYLAILLAYAVKVLVTGEAPKNLLSPIILLAGVFGFVGSTLLEAVRRDPAHPGVARLIRWLPLPMLALLPFALWAVWVRREQYGWTEFRYLRFAILLALGVLAVVGTVRLLRRRDPVLLLVPMVLGATLLLSAVGPWGASAVSRRSQQARLRAGLAQAGLLPGGTVARPLTRADEAPGDTLLVAGETYRLISGSLLYLYDQHGADAVQPLFAASVRDFDGGRELLGALRFRAGCEPQEQIRFVSASLPGDSPVPGLPAGSLYRVQGTRDPAEGDTGQVRLRFSDRTAVVTIDDEAGDWTGRADVTPVFARLTGSGPDGCSVEREGLTMELSAAEARRPLVDAAGRERGVMVITEAVVVRPGDGPEVDLDLPLRLDRLDALVVVRE